MTLNLWISADDDDDVDSFLSAGFEEQRNIEQYHVGASGTLLRQKFHLAFANQRMDDRFQAFKAVGIKSELAAKFMPIDCSILHRAGKGGIHQGRSLAGIEIVDHGIRIVHRDSGIGKEL